jgi:hypothetical protein
MRSTKKKQENLELQTGYQRGRGVLIRSGPCSMVNKYMSPKTNQRGMLEGHRIQAGRVSYMSTLIYRAAPTWSLLHTKGKSRR